VNRYRSGAPRRPQAPLGGVIREVYGLQGVAEGRWRGKMTGPWRSRIVRADAPAVI